MTGFLACYSSPVAQAITTWMQHQLTAPPLAAYARMQQAAKDQDAPTAIRYARQFVASIPRPHPADAFGEKYRLAVTTLMNAGETTGNLPLCLEAGELALAFDPNDSVLLFKYGRALAAAGRRDKSVELLEAAFRIRPTAPQILHALESQLANVSSERIKELRQRHLEALALCMTFPTWMTGNLVAATDSQAKGFDLHLSVGNEITIAENVGFKPTRAYLVLPRMPELEIRVTSARLIGAGGEIALLKPVPQINLLPQGDGFVRIATTDTEDFDTPTVIGLELPAQTPADPRIEIRIECRPSPPVAEILHAYGTWQHPGVKTVTTD